MPTHSRKRHPLATRRRGLDVGIAVVKLADAWGWGGVLGQMLRQELPNVLSYHTRVANGDLIDEG